MATFDSCKFVDKTDVCWISMPYENNKGNGMRLALLKNEPFGFTGILLIVILETVTL